MEFNHDTLSSKVFVYYEIALAVMRLIYTVVFAYALWRMWTSLRDDQNPNKKVNRGAFYIHLIAMILYTASRGVETVAFVEAAWNNNLPKKLYFWNDIFANLCATICYFLIIYFCWSMYEDYMLMKAN